MKLFGILLFIVGMIWAGTIISAVDDHTRSMRYKNDFKDIIYDISKREDQRNNLILSGMVIIVGSIFFVGGSLKSSQAKLATPSIVGLRKCPSCAEMVRLEAKICRFCHQGMPDIPVSEIVKEV